MNDSSQRAIIDLRQTLSQIIPWTSAQQAPRMILAQKPLQLPSDISVKHQPAPSLRVNGKNKSNLFLAQDKNEAMHAIRFPYLCYVLEGEIDMRLGIPSGQRKTVNDYQLFTLPAQTCLLIPPGVFYPDLQQSLENSSLPPSDSKVLWVRILPNGAFCHTSMMRKGKYTIEHRDVFVPDLRLSVLV